MSLPQTPPKNAPQTPPLSSRAQTSTPYKPLTDPAELFTLLGRMVICMVLVALTIVLLVQHQIAFALFVGGISIFVQRLTIKMWRRMRDERQAAEAALLTEPTELSVGSEGNAA